MDLFSKHIDAVPLANKDAITVLEALFNFICTFVVCNTLVADQGTEFTAQVTRTIWNMLQIPQEFTPSIVHQCLGVCERTHATLKARLTPYMNLH